MRSTAIKMTEAGSQSRAINVRTAVRKCERMEIIIKQTPLGAKAIYKTSNDTETMTPAERKARLKEAMDAATECVKVLENAVDLLTHGGTTQQVIYAALLRSRLDAQAWNNSFHQANKERMELRAENKKFRAMLNQCRCGREEEGQFPWRCENCGSGYSNPDLLGTPGVCCHDECRGLLIHRNLTAVKPVTL